MNSIIKYALCAIMAFPLSAAADTTVLSVADHLNDSTIVIPESMETDVQKMMQNWYLQNYTALDKDVDSRPDAPVSDEELIKRLQSIPTTIELPFNSVVRNYIELYTGRKRSLVESMLGMSLYYMPIFEQAIEREGLPLELKYLPIIESALNPEAVSRAGAVGLWQMMLPTARGLGLEVNTLVDERRDPIASSAAAARYLHQLNDIFNDWHLTIAAYNCGPGNVTKALRRAGAENDSTKKDFWAIYPYLPQETRGYVPCFIAATYVMNHYNKHNISPALARKPILTDSVHVHRRVNFKQIADVLHLPVEALQALNPQYRKDEIPGDIKPYSLVLPANQVYSYILSEDDIAARNADLYTRRSTVEPATGMEPRYAVVDGQEGEWVTEETVKYHKVRRNETMSSIAKKYGVTLTSLKRANGGISKPKRGATLKVITTKEVFRPIEREPEPVIEPNDNLLVANDASASSNDTADSVDAPETSMQETSAETPAETSAAAMGETVTEPEAETHEAAAVPEAEETIAEADSSAVRNKVAGTFSNSREKQREADSKAQSERKQKEQTSASSSRKKNKEKAAPATHTVRKGESLYIIAQKHGTTVKALQRINGMKGNKIKPGDKIKLK